MHRSMQNRNVGRIDGKLWVRSLRRGLEFVTKCAAEAISWERFQYTKTASPWVKHACFQGKALFVTLPSTFQRSELQMFALERKISPQGLPVIDRLYSPATRARI